jgi:hypothetical protein
VISDPAERQPGVNSGLTPNRLPERRATRPRKRPKRQRETAEYADMVERMILAYGRRVAGGDVEELPRMISMHQVLEEALDQAVIGLREFGYSWRDIARRTGTSRQAAQQRWARSKSQTGETKTQDQKTRGHSVVEPVRIGPTFLVWLDSHEGASGQRLSRCTADSVPRWGFSGPCPSFARRGSPEGRFPVARLRCPLSARPRPR